MLNSGRRGKRSADGYGIISVNEKFNQTNYPIPVIDSWAITDGSYVPTDDTALDTAGGQTVVLYGSGFTSGVTVNINGTNISPVTLLDSGRVTFTSPTLASATYTIYLSNSNGATAIYVPGLIYSGLPTWSSPAAGTIGTAYETKAVSALSSNTFIATGDAPITYSIYSGNLPSGVTLSSSGVLSGTLPATASSTTYSFTIRATDAQNQDSNRSFSLTISPDVVTWVAPSLNGSLTVYETQQFSTTLSATSAAGYGVLYAANTLPTGITLNANTGAFTGYANTVGNTYAQLTATANTTGRYANSNVAFIVNQDVVTWSSPANNTTYSYNLGAAISPITLSATSAAGYGAQYTADTLPTGISLSAGTISGTPSVSGTSATQFTATSNTTNRSSVVYINWSITVASDTYFANTVMLLSANSSYQTSSFAFDNSNNNSQITVVGDTKANYFNPYQPGYYSNYFDGSGDYLSVPAAATPIGNGAYTVEFWIYRTAAPGITRLFEKGTNTTDFSMDLAVDGTITINNNTTITGSTTTIPISLNKWTHVALVRTSTGTNDTRWYINGAAAGTFTHDTNISSVNSMFICASGGTGYFLTGHLSNLRIVSGTAVYSAAFTPSTTPLLPIANTVLLTCQSNSLVDVSTRYYTITKGGDTTVSSAHPFTTVYQAGTQYYSTYFNGSSDYLTTSTNAAFTYGTSDFTIEMWVYITANPGDYAYIYSQGPNTTASMCVYIQGGVFRVWNGSNIITGSTSYSLNTWYHVALARSGTSLKLFVNGVQDGSATNSSNVTTGTTYGGTIGRWIEISDTRYYTGYVSNLRVVKGTAVYTAAFTPPTSPLTAISGTSLLTCQDSTFKDNSTNAFTITAATTTVKPLPVSPFTPNSYSNTAITTYGSGYFDGSGDYLSYAINNSVLTNWYSQSTTIEAWIYPTASVTYTNNYPVIINNGATGSSTCYWAFGINGLSVRFAYFNGAGQSVQSTGTVTLNTWTHIAFVYNNSDSSIKLYINGVLDGSATKSGTPQSDSTLGLLTGSWNGGSFAGYISNLRVLNGTALYTSNFVPQFTSPLTAVANTQLLTCQTNGLHNNSTIRDSSSFNTSITRNGNIHQGTFSPYGDNWSVYFDGTGDYLSVADNDALDGFTGDFTVEFWVNFSSVTSGVTLSKGWTSGSTFSAYVWTLSGGNLLFYASSTGSSWNLASGVTALASPSANKWYHIALTRSGTTVRLFANGTQTYSFTSSATFLNSTDTLTVGSAGGGYTPMTGYVSNVRVVKGTALYTSSFTPSTTPLTAVANTSFLSCQSNRFIDNSPYNFTITRNGDSKVQNFSPFASSTTIPKYYSTNFNGSSDYLSLTSQSVLALGSGDFTVEMWLYNDYAAIPTNATLFDQRNGTNGAGVVQPVTELTSASGYTWYVTASNRISSTTTPVKLRTWQHLAISRVSGSTRMFVDGVQVGSTYTDSNNYPAGSIYIGRANDGASTRYHTGHINNLRVIVGTGLYSSTFTPSTTPLTAVANTQLLTCQSSTFIDNSNNNIKITAATSTVKPLLVSPFTPTANTGVSYSTTTFGGSMYFDGNTDYLVVPAAAGMSGTGYSWTIQGWFYPLNTTGGIFDAWNGGVTSFLLRLTGSLEFYATGGSTTSVSGITTGRWYHFAVVKDVNNSNTIQMYLNGVKVGTAIANYTTSISSTNIGVGGNPNSGNEPFVGYMSDIQIIRGAALYTSNFYPDSMPVTAVRYSNNRTDLANTGHSSLLLSGTSGAIIDQSKSLNIETVGDIKLTQFSPYSGNNYSWYLNGSSGYVSSPSITLAGDFTIEMWINTSAAMNSQRFTTFFNMGTSIYIQYDHENNPGDKLRVSVGALLFSPTTTLTPNVWHHVALVRSGSTVTLYSDGVNIASGSDSSSMSGVVYMSGTSTLGFTGNISNLRVLNGTALYTTTFTPPSASLSAISNTALLTCQSSKFVDNSTNNYTLTLGGTPLIQTQNPFGLNSGQSYYFDGTGDWLYANSTQSQITTQFFTGDYTVEYWVYPGSYTTAATHTQIGNLKANTTASTGATTVYGGAAGTTLLVTGGAITGNAWSHVAVTRQSGVGTTLWINGTRSGAVAVDSTSYANSAVFLGVTSAGTFPFLGYISDYRITNGYARYTANNTTYLSGPYINK